MTWMDLVGILLVFLGHILWMPNLSKNPFSKRKTVLFSILWYLCATGSCLLVGFFLAEDFSKAVSWMFLASCAVFFGTYLLFFGGGFWKKLFLFLSHVNFFCIIHNLSVLLMRPIFYPENPVAFRMSAIFLRFFLQMAGLFFYVRFLKRKIEAIQDLDQRQWLPLCVAAALFVCLNSIWTALGTNVWHYTTAQTIGFFLLLIVTVGLSVVIFYTISCMHTISEVQLVKQQSRYLQEQVKNYEVLDDTNRRLRHDMRHHLRSVTALLQEGNVQSALAYLNHYDQEVLSVAPKHYAKHPALQSVLSAYAAKFQENQIPLAIHCDVPEQMGITDVDLISLLGNLLENALHGCLACQREKKASLFLKTQKETLVLLCENTCVPTMELEDGLPKKRGVGIASMLAVCANYQGQMGYTVKEGICSVCIALPFKKKER